MATYKSDIYAIQDGTSAPSKAPMGTYNGRERMIYFEVTSLVAVVGTSDVIKLCKIPAGARVIDWKIFVPDVGTTGTLKVGWAASSDAAVSANDVGFGAATAYTSSGGAFIVPTVAEAVSTGGLFKKFSSSVDAQIVPTVATDAGAVTIKGFFSYVID